MAYNMRDKIGKYKVLRELGAGGFGAVYLAEDPRLHVQVAIKIFQVKDATVAGQATSATGDAGEVLKQRFIDEARMLRSLAVNPHIVDMYEFDELTDGTPYYVMPYLATSLVDEIGKDAFTVGALEELDSSLRPKRLGTAQSILYLKQLLDALSEVHKAGLIHRDIKPANILVNNKGQVQLCDFGIAKLPDTEHSQSGLGMGSRNYMSPEQRDSAKHVTPASDIYSVGILAYRMLTGQLPLGRFQDPIDYAPDIGQTLNNLILHAIEQHPGKRPQDANDMLSALKQAEHEIAGTVPNQQDEQTGTWVGGNAGHIDANQIKAELKPLQTKIIELLQEHGEVRAEDKGLLNALAAIGNIDEAGLNELITQTANRQTNPEQQAFQHWVATLNSQIEKHHALSDDQLNALLHVGSRTGRDEQQLKDIISHKTKGALVKAEQLKFKTAAEEKPKGKTRNKGLLFIVLALLITGGGYFGYGYYQTQQKQQKQARLATLKGQQQTEQVKQAQSLLAQLGYQVASSGTLDTRTENAIEAFEKEEKLLVTGQIDDILLASLQAALDRKDNSAWQVAGKQNSLAGYRAYLIKQTKGQYRSQAQQGIDGIELDNSKVPLNVNTTPADARIQILNIKESYISGMRLLPKDYQIKISKPGYHSQTHTVSLTKGKKILEYELKSQDFLVKLGNSQFIMKTIPSGKFMMGSNGGDSDEKPIHQVTIPSFRMMESEATFAMWDTCVSAGGCESKPDERWGRGTQPVIRVSYNDITTQFIPWLNKATGQTFTLPSEAQWEYAARAGTITKYSWGDDIGRNNANCNGCGSQWDNKQTAPVKSFKPNAFGLYDMHGNVWEWIRDCHNDSYNGAPTNGSPWTSGDCARRVLRGGSWDRWSDIVRSANRYKDSVSGRNDINGFRLVRGF
ncbi:MAG: formylglycine-generating enzyme required for sulfatase activity/serine/threonine protein kinase [Paraglaciecola sp.]|jgi:formylglycine-generating enzyme required for sulfatase activity/serine/threonine protein kinase